MRDIGVRLARQKLLSYRQPEPRGRRWRRWIVLGVVAWGAWALLVSDHSVSRLLKLRTERDRLRVELARQQAELERAERRVPDADKPTPEQAELMLRERHIYAREDEIIYLLGEDSTKARKQKSR